jgi:hypothetical protein
LLLVLNLKVISQSVSGYVLDENNNPLPFVNIYLKYQNRQGTITDTDGKYYMQLPNGQYTLVFSILGYEKKEVEVTITHNKDVTQNVWLKPSSVALNEMVVKAKRRDPAYDIIKQAIDRKDKYLKQIDTLHYEAYIKAKESSELTQKALEKQEKQDQKKQKKKNKNNSTTEGLDTAYSVASNPMLDSLNKLHLSIAEIILDVYYVYPNKYKEIVKAKKITGNSFGLFYTSTTEADFNFYNNIVEVPRLSEVPIISPLSRTALLSYKYKLEETTFDSAGTMIYKIAVTPRKKGNATVEGFIWIEDKSFAIKKLDVIFDSEGLIKYKSIEIKQWYTIVKDTIRLLKKQEFYYSSKAGSSLYFGQTIVNYKNYDLKPEIPHKFFNAEKGVVLEDAYEKDNDFWKDKRPEPLTKEEQQYIAYRDSIQKVVTSKEYLDSVDAEYNKIKLDKIFWYGQGWRKRSKHKSWWFGSIWNYWEPIGVGGMRAGPYLSYFKKFDSQKMVWVNYGSTYGFRNKDITGSVSVNYLYDPFHLGYIGVGGGHQFDLINPYDAFVNLIRRSNFILKDYGTLTTSRELFNGFYIYADFQFNNRYPITGLQFGSLADSLFNQPNEPVDFEPYKSFISGIKLTYTPKQAYIKEPKRKIVLGSKFPTFSFYYRKGWNGLFGSDIDFDYIELGIEQQFKLGTLGTSNYRIASGTFINTNDLRFIDYKYQRRGDPFLYSNPLYSYQLIPETFPTLGWYIESHYLHHFNGAIINNLPVIKKLKIFSVAGAGVMYDFVSNYQYSELFVGIEKTFFILRRRFRFGVYGVAAQSSNGLLNPQLKFSIEQFNNRENKWRF